MLHLLIGPLGVVGPYLGRRVRQEDRDIVMSHQVPGRHESISRIVSNPADHRDPFARAHLVHYDLGHGLTGIFHERIDGDPQVFGVDVEHPYLLEGEHNLEYENEGVKFFQWKGPTPHGQRFIPPLRHFEHHQYVQEGEEGYHLILGFHSKGRTSELQLSDIKRIVLDVLKPHHPSIVELSQRLSVLSGTSGVNISIVEVDQDTETVKITIEGNAIIFDDVESAITEAGAVIHSVDSVSAGKRLVEEVETFQDR